MSYKISLDTEEIKALIDDLNLYKDDLINRCQPFIEKLANIGIKVVDATYGTGLGDSSKAHKCEFFIDQDGNVAKGKLIVSGEDILFVEFGAGIVFNKGNQHPKAHDLGYGVGTYPNQTHAYSPTGWVYRDSDGTLRPSLGTEATMPVYKASLEMIERIEEVAEEVFGSG